MQYLGLRVVGALAVLILAGSACGAGADDEPPVGGSGGTGANGGEGAQGGTGGNGGTGAGGEGGSLGGGTSDGGGFQGCTGIVCGNGDCCSKEQECVVDSCLAVCETEIRCGEDLSTCCEAGNVCIGGACTVPGNPCADWADCAEDEFCEPSIDACLPQPSGEPLCEYKPPTGPLTPVLEWSWTGSTIKPTFNQVINMPVVVDLDADDTPDVVIVTSDGFSGGGPAYLRALDGATGLEKWTSTSNVYLNANRVQPRATPAAGDIDGDGAPEIVTAKMGGGLIAFESNGNVKWTSKNINGTPLTTALDSVTIALADFEGDGTVEIVAGGLVFESTGVLRFNAGVYVGANNSSYGAVSIVADIDNVGGQELLSGQRAFRSNGAQVWNNGLTDGYPAIADLDLDGDPELVVVAVDTVRVQNPVTGAVLASVAMPGTGDGGPPTIADFDADGVPEIASANGSAYSVYEYSPTPPTLTVKWQKPTQDISSNRTGSSVFDFQGDGAAEVVYNDECYLRVYNGADGTIVYEEPNSSATIHEYPVIVDVDGDNNTEIVVVANDLNHHETPTLCPYGVAGSRTGVFVYGDSDDNWVRTRRVWNQHAYHITNVDGAGMIPGPESPSWVPPGLNNYRQSSQGAGVFNAPDLQVSLAADLDTCPLTVKLRARVRNQGSLGVEPGVVVRIFRGTDASGTLLGETMTTQILLPGQYEEIVLPYTLLPTDDVMSFYVEVDKDDVGMDAIHECLEDNNEASVDGVACPPPT